MTARTCDIPTFPNVITETSHSFWHRNEKKRYYPTTGKCAWKLLFTVFQTWSIQKDPDTTSNPICKVQIIYQQHSPSLPQQYKWLIPPRACTTSRVCKFHTCPVTHPPLSLPPFSPLPFWRAWRAENPVWFQTLQQKADQAADVRTRRAFLSAPSCSCQVRLSDDSVD